jgi:hypothetical protein
MPAIRGRRQPHADFHNHPSSDKIAQVCAIQAWKYFPRFALLYTSIVEFNNPPVKLAPDKEKREKPVYTGFSVR